MRPASPVLLSRRLWIVSLCLLCVLPVCAMSYGEASQWNGFACHDLDLEGRTGKVVAPAAPAEGAPWLLLAAPPAPESVVVQKLLEKGFHAAWMDAGELYGNDDAVKAWDMLYEQARARFALAEKATLMAEGSGAILLYNWAAAHPSKGACIFADRPWLRLKPLAGQGDEENVAKQAPDMHSVETDEGYEKMPLGRAAAVGAAEIPVMHFYPERRPGIHSDKVIEQFYAAYRSGGRGEFESHVMPTPVAGARYDLTVAPLVFVLKHTGHLPAAAMESPLETLSYWQPADFAGGAAVRVLDNIVILEHGNDMTGVAYAGEIPKGGYEISLDAMRLFGGDFFCGLTAPYKDTCFSLVVGGWGGTCVGISSIDWLDAYHNETARFRSFDDHRWHRVRLRVVGDVIQAWIDGEETVNINVAERELDIRWEMAPTKPLGIATWRTTGAIKNFTVHVIEEDEADSTP